MNPVAFVVQPLPTAELAEMYETFDRAVAGIEVWLKHGIDRAMNVVNAQARNSSQPDDRAGEPL